MHHKRGFGYMFSLHGEVPVAFTQFYLCKVFFSGKILNYIHLKCRKLGVVCGQTIEFAIIHAKLVCSVPFPN